MLFGGQYDLYFYVIMSQGLFIHSSEYCVTGTDDTCK